MPMERASSVDLERAPSSATEYRERFMSPRREDYVPHVVLPKIGTARPPSSRTFLSFDVDPSKTMTSSEYRLGFPNHHPKRPYVFHAQPSHVFDHVPKPPNPKQAARLSASVTSLKDTEYQERFPNYRSFIPMRELQPAHISLVPNKLSETQLKRERMDRSQYFHQLVTDDDKLHGGHRYFGASEQRSAFQWPLRPSYQQSAYQQQQQMQEGPPQVYPPYFVPRNIYEPMPTVRRASVNAFN